MKRKSTIVMATALASVLLLNTSIWVTPSKAEEPIKNNSYATIQKTSISEVTKQAELAKLAESIRLAQISARKAKQEEIDRIAIERPTASKQARLAPISPSELNLNSITTRRS